jgi:hypothetical protein
MAIDNRPPLIELDDTMEVMGFEGATVIVRLRGERYRTHVTPHPENPPGLPPLWYNRGTDLWRSRPPH